METKDKKYLFATDLTPLSKPFVGRSTLKSHAQIRDVLIWGIRAKINIDFCFFFQVFPVNQINNRTITILKYAVHAI